MKIVHVIARLNVGGAALSVLELAAGQQRARPRRARRRRHDPAGRGVDGDLADELGVPYLHLPALQRELSPAQRRAHRA